MSFNVNQKLEITKLRISYLAIYIKVVVVTPYIKSVCHENLTISLHFTTIYQYCNFLCLHVVALLLVQLSCLLKCQRSSYFLSPSPLHHLWQDHTVAP